MLQSVFADNAISYTINFGHDVTTDEIETALRVHLPHLKGTTLMPGNNSRPQTPLEQISEEEFLEAKEKGIAMISDSERECLNGACSIK